MRILDLGGTWHLEQVDGEHACEATVPGCVHTDLLADGQIPDPYYRDQELQCRWPGAADWRYRRAVELDDQMLSADRLELICEGLDTFATVRLNGTILGRTANMFRTWRWDISRIARAGANRLEIEFRSPLPEMARRQKARPLPAWGSDHHKVFGGNWIRKMQCNFGWDWAPTLITCGIWRPIRIEATDTARIAEIAVSQSHRRGKVDLTVDVAVETTGSQELAARVCLLDGEQVAGEQTVPVAKGAARAEIALGDPKLWWPNGLGDQPLYELCVEIQDAAGQTVDTDMRRIGLRRLELVRQDDQWGQSFHFRANGVDFFAKGANWIPADALPTRLEREDYRRLLVDAAAVHFNFIRVWGGGIYEDDAFYEICDELGICVWQDFMFACASYPTFDADWMDNVAVEAEENVKRLGHHACLAVWCGNNELEQGLVGKKWTEQTMSWADYKKLFDTLLGRVVAEHDPQRTYWPCSPHSPVGDRDFWQNPDCGDVHLWGVWHGLKPFEWYRSCLHRFCSEFGFQSFPHPRTVEGYTAPEDRNVTSYVMEHHQRSGIGNKTILTYMLDWFRMPRSFEQTVWLSQIIQALGMKYAVEHWRRNMPRCMGALYWQLNDCWPVASWSSIDAAGRWKALHYLARRFFAPLLISGVERPDDGKVEIHLTSDLPSARTVTAAWQATDLEGNLLLEGSRDCRTRVGGSIRAAVVDCRSLLTSPGPRGLLIWLDLLADGKRIARDLVTFCRPKHMQLPDPALSFDLVEAGDGVFDVMVKTERPALWVWLDAEGLDARPDDNFFHLAGRSGKAVRLQVDPSVDAGQVKAALRVRSLRDTY